MISSLPWLLAGAAVAAVNAVMRRRTVSALSVEAVSASVTRALSGMILRLGLVAALLIVSLNQGIGPGLLAFAGLWITRGAIILCVGAGLPEILEHVPESPDD